LVALALTSLGACSSPAAPEQRVAAAAAPAIKIEWTRFVDEFVEAHFVAQPATAVTKGRHEFDGQLPDWTRAGIQKEIARLEQARPCAGVPGPGAVSRGALPARLFRQLRRQQPVLCARRTHAVHQPDVVLLVRPRSGPVRVDALRASRTALARVHQIPETDSRVTQTIKANLQTPLASTFLTYGEKSFGGFAEFFRTDAPKAFAEVQDAQLRSELNGAIEPAAQAMHDIGQWFRNQKPGGNEAYVLGPKLFATMLRMNELVTTPLDELEAIGRADLERNLAALKDQCERLAPKASIEACIAQVNGDKPQGGAVAGARQQLAQLRQFIIDHDVVSIPGEEEALVMEAPAYRRQNSAYINIPGPYEKNLPSIYRIAPPDPTWLKAEQVAYLPGRPDLLFTSVHEVWPGHFLQFLHSNRASWRFGQLFVEYAFAEGWAHYSEELMIEKGLAQGAPEMHIAQLLKALLRNVRYQCAFGLHTHGTGHAHRHIRI
jgi:hypothetical protein